MRRELSRLSDVRVPIRAVYGDCALSIADILTLGERRVVPLDRPVGSLVDLYVADELIARGEVIAVENRIAVRVVEIFDDGGRAR